MTGGEFIRTDKPQASRGKLGTLLILHKRRVEGYVGSSHSRSAGFRICFPPARPYAVVVRIAFKEWAIVVDALGRGEQILILRKGGISEGRGGFQLTHREFFLFPTLFHQQRESVTLEAQDRFAQIAPHLPAPEIVRIEYFAEVVEARQLESLSTAEGLRGQHCWRDEVIAERFDWGPSANIFALALRVHRLALPVELPMLPNYGGCRSWVEFEQDIPTTGARPVLEPAAFDRKLAQFLSALNPTVNT